MSDIKPAQPGKPDGAALEYLSKTTIELAIMAKRSQLPMLEYLLSMAAAEAADLLRLDANQNKFDLGRRE